MIRTTVTPQNTVLQLSLVIPEDYVGKAIEVLIFATDEPQTHPSAKNKAASSFRGALHLSNEQYQDLQQHVNNIRSEWDRDI